MSTGAIAAAVRRAERHLVESLRQAGATSPASAQPLPELRRMEARRLGRFRSGGVIVEPEPGRYYLDEAAYASYRSRRRVVVLAVLVVLAAVVGVAAWLA